MNIKELKVGDKIKRITPYGFSYLIITRTTKTQAIAENESKTVKIKFRKKYNIIDVFSNKCILDVVPKTNKTMLIDYYILN